MPAVNPLLVPLANLKVLPLLMIERFPLVWLEPLEVADKVVLEKAVPVLVTLVISTSVIWTPSGTVKSNLDSPQAPA